MSTYAELSHRLTEALALIVPPVAMRFVDEPPSGVGGPGEPAPAGCSFWERGAKQAVVTRALDHQHCAIGVHTHNLAGASETQPQALQSTLAAMQGLDYVRPEEVAAIPVLSRSSSYVVYEPLAGAEAAPSVVLVFAQAAQGLVLSEALARVDGRTPIALGRPACALVPQVMNSGLSAVSLGCCGARAYIDVMTDDIALWGLNGEKLEAYATAIETLARANSVLTRFHALRRQDIEGGTSPSIEESLARLQG